MVIEIMLMTAVTMKMTRGRRRTVLKTVMTIGNVARFVLRSQIYSLELSSFSAMLFVICLSLFHLKCKQVFAYG